ncbi:MAG: hypothetical protein K0S45_2973 [Nitrospira sp.]|jgi:hypothetical protein|nr:hypothetical protein [Nitrospira sp.]
MVQLFVMMHQHVNAVEKACACETSPALRREKDDKHVEGVVTLLSDVIKHERDRALGVAVDERQRRQLDARLKMFCRDNFSGYEEFRTSVNGPEGTISLAM